MKKCTKCNTYKILLDFGKSKTKKDGLYHWCKECVKLDNHRRRKVKENGHRWKMDLQKEGLKFCSKCSTIKPFSEYSKKITNYSLIASYCKTCTSTVDKEYREKLHKKGVLADRKKAEYNRNKDTYNKYTFLYNKEKRDYKLEYQTTLKLREKNPLAKLRNLVRNRLLVGIKYRGFKKNSPSIKILGADWGVIEKHISDQFLNNMSWDNHGEWHIDHKIPLASAKNEGEFFKLCHYTNLQPLWKIDNLKKGCKFTS